MAGVWGVGFNHCGQIGPENKDPVRSSMGMDESGEAQAQSKPWKPNTCWRLQQVAATTSLNHTPAYWLAMHAGRSLGPFLLVCIIVNARCAAGSDGCRQQQVGSSESLCRWRFHCGSWKVCACRT